MIIGKKIIIDETEVVVIPYVALKLSKTEKPKIFTYKQLATNRNVQELFTDNEHSFYIDMLDSDYVDNKTNVCRPVLDVSWNSSFIVEINGAKVRRQHLIAVDKVDTTNGYSVASTLDIGIVNNAIKGIPDSKILFYRTLCKLAEVTDSKIDGMNLNINDNNANLDKEQVIDEFTTLLISLLDRGMREVEGFVEGKVPMLIGIPTSITDDPDDEDLRLEIEEYNRDNSTIDVSKLATNVSIKMDVPEDELSISLPSGSDIFVTYSNKINRGENIEALTLAKEFNIYDKINEVIKPYIDPTLSHSVNYTSSRDKLINIIGNVNNNVPDIYENEEEFLYRLKQLYYSIFSLEYGNISESEVISRIEEKGEKSKVADDFFYDFCLSACYINWEHTNAFPIIDLESNDDEESDGDADAEKEKKKNEKGEVTSKYVFQVSESIRTGSTDTSNVIKTNGLLSLRPILDREQEDNPYAVLNILVRLLRWGDRKPSKIYLDNSGQYLNVKDMSLGLSGSFDNLEIIKSVDDSYITPYNLIYASYNPVGSEDITMLHQMYNVMMYTKVQIPVGITGIINYRDTATGSFESQTVFIPLHDAIMSLQSDECPITDLEEFLENTKLYNNDFTPHRDSDEGFYDVIKCLDSSLGSTNGSIKVLKSNYLKEQLIRYKVQDTDINALNPYRYLNSPDKSLTTLLNKYDSMSEDILNELLSDKSYSKDTINDLLNIKTVYLYLNMSLRIQMLVERVSRKEVPGIEELSDIDGSVLLGFYEESLSNVRMEELEINSDKDIIDPVGRVSENILTNTIKTETTTDLFTVDSEEDNALDIEEEVELATVNDVRSFLKDSNDFKRQFVLIPDTTPTVYYLTHKVIRDGVEGVSALGFIYRTISGQFVVTFKYRPTKQGKELMAMDYKERYEKDVNEISKEFRLGLEEAKTLFLAGVGLSLVSSSFIPSKNMLYFSSIEDYDKFVNEYLGVM